jgi:hypothetical protein
MLEKLRVNPNVTELLPFVIAYKVFHFHFYIEMVKIYFNIILANTFVSPMCCPTSEF